MSMILGTNVVPTTYADVVASSLQWAAARESRVLVFANVHVVMEAYDDPAYRALLNAADIVSPDGVPLVWALKLLGEGAATRVYGPDWTMRMLEAASAHGVPVGFFGGSQAVLDELVRLCKAQLPELQVPFAVSPPFRPMTEAEDAAVVQQIADSGARILFIGLGCPKQERWMAAHAGRVPAVMCGVGAAFDFLAGTKKQAPRWMMRTGTEWIFRFATEPSRLARRYLRNNPRFVAFFLRQLLSRAPRAAALGFEE